VLADPSSPSGWSFRSSHDAALRAYEHAFALHLPMLSLFSARGYATLRSRMYTIGTMLRSGSSDDGRSFLAYPSWQGDSRALVPHPRAAFDARAAGVVPATHAAALSRQQRRFDALASLWATEMPHSAAAQEARAIALEMLGDAGATAALRDARRLATDSATAARLAAAEAWLLFKRGLPDDTASVQRARVLGDSLLAATAHWPPRSRHFLASLAVLTGRPELAASLAAFTPDDYWEGQRWPERLRTNGQLVIAYAALGGPRDTVQSLEKAIDADITTVLPPAERDNARAALLRRAAMLAYPFYRFRQLDALAAADGLVAAQRAHASGDNARAEARAT
jgi:hypothetical protein